MPVIPELVDRLTPIYVFHPLDLHRLCKRRLRLQDVRACINCRTVDRPPSLSKA